MGVAAAPQLDDVQQAALQALRREGIAIVPFGKLFGDERLWAELYDDIGAFAGATEEQLAEPRRAEKGKSFIARRFLTKAADARFAVDNPWLRLSVSSPLLDVVSAYRGEPVRLIDFDNWYTIPEPEVDARVKSQQWHRDPWDEHITKVFVYFSDVDEDSGPFEYVPDSAPGGRYGDLWPWRPEGVYPPQEEFDAAIPPSEWLTATGPAGTVIFCDTSGFHRGGWAKRRPRIMSVHTYVGSGSTKQPRYEIDGSVDDSDLSAVARSALA